MMRRNGPPSSSPSAIVYIGLLPFEWDEENLKAVVCGMGNVTDVRLGFDHVGKNKGYAFVEFETPQQAQRAMGLLSQVTIEHPGSRQPKTLRIELSKEGFRTGNSEHKTVIPPNFAFLPPGVQLPGEVYGKYPAVKMEPGMGQGMNHMGPMGQMGQNRPVAQMGPGNGFRGNLPSVAPPNAANTLPDRYLRALQTLPQVELLPFATPDKINQTLALIPPAQLIELVANLKQLLATGNAARAAEVFQISPQLATSATQALLLMGFIDEEVIAEAMKAESTPQPQQFQQYPQQGFQQQQYPQQQQGFQPQFQQGFQQPGFQQQQQQPQFGQAQPSKWPNLPLSAQMKLGNMPPDQADLVAQVLSLTNDQISALPPDRQNMVAGIRQQYL